MVVPSDDHRRVDTSPVASATGQPTGAPRLPRVPGSTRRDLAVGKCNQCGYQWDWSAPLEAVPVIMDIPARVMSALQEAALLDGSALERGAQVAELLHATSKRLLLVFEQTRTDLTPPHTDTPPLPSTGMVSLPIVRAALCASAADLARTVSQARPQEWTFTARQEGRTVTAETLLREALANAHNHLHDLWEFPLGPTDPTHTADPVVAFDDGTFADEPESRELSG